MKKQKTFQTNKQNIHGQKTYTKIKCSNSKGRSAGRRTVGVGRNLDVQKDMEGSTNGLTAQGKIFLSPTTPQDRRWYKNSSTNYQHVKQYVRKIIHRKLRFPLKGARLIQPWGGGEVKSQSLGVSKKP